VLLHDEPALAVLIHPGHAGGQVGADDRLAAGHGLELHHPERLRAGHRWQHEHVARVIEGQQLAFVDLTE
jgi:hypothetical protein